ncbi:MAG TPA: hypothetical protein VGM82_15355 [Gemmatimonadaceae bacterium]|jgi:hypothetical protein
MIDVIARSRVFRTLCSAVVALLLLPTTSRSQAPNLDWRTISTTHFFVHFNPQTEGFARRVAADAERAYAQLAAQFHPPRGKIDIVISDDVDASNGSATPFPTNRIVVFANPPVTESALRYTNDWGQMVISHELTHIFHLDRTRGIWSIGQHVFGRAAALFPNLYSPSWAIEGLAVYEESKIAGAGRIEGSEHRMIARSAAIDHTFPNIGALSLAQGRFPYGEEAYGYGSLFIDYVARTRGEAKVRDFIEKSAADLPYLYDIPARQAFGVSFSKAWRDFRDSIQRSVPAYSDPIAGWKQITRDGNYVLSPRWLTDTSIVYSGTPGRESFGAYRVDINGKRTRIGRRNSQSANVPIGPNRFLYSQNDYVNPYQVRADLWISDRGHERQITFGQRLVSPDARADGQIVAQQIIPGATRLVLVSRDGKNIRPITGGSYDEQWTEPRWSHHGDKIAAVRWLRGNLSQIVILDTLGNEIKVLASQRSIQATPSWSYDDAGVYYSSDYTGEAQVYFSRLDGPTYRVSKAGTGLFEPQASPRADHLAAVLFRSDGYHLGVAPCCDATAAQWPVEPAQMATLPTDVAPIVIDSSPAKKYSPLRTLLPRYWLPTLDPGIHDGYRIGALTSGRDVIGRHSMDASLRVPTDGVGGITGSIDYQYSGFGLPILQLDASQDWESLGYGFQRNADRTPIGEVFRRTLSGDALLTWLHTRARSAISLSGGVGIEHRTHVLDGSDIPLSSFDTTGALGSPTFPNVVVAASYANTQRPAYSISAEDGVSLGVTVRDRFNSGANGDQGSSYSTVGQAAIYKSLDLPGFAHHVIALRASGGIADERAAGYFLVGGVSGSSYEIIPGYTLGEGRKTFPVRGFESGTLGGTRAATASAEYRIPLLLMGGAPGPLPFFFDRSSLTLFGDYGVAWCPDINADREVCNQPRSVLTDKLDISSVGAELNLNLGLLSWDTPYRFRLGVVSPMANRDLFGRQRVQMYMVAGISF